ncbi:deoxynucleoside kinase [Flammeovirga kamogawensis]|uniref:Deoxynucleoside kinase n=1 Tax=Flammeovirga kamogawensis TaxID=373891 RepID=A0ABX8GQU2_9BACT|nr:deoxynucleoside kinase [Flammeovirga kamogawensis]MBB6463210.1 deoxyadenosine/deoxycytidine kinase [Flammeovirga kamogawensis]QWG05938.1 deoxynucleoside kinase [Flammeovirga kamogawensis]TRX67763.1 deoxynucleoside kinase [Flammeovirga kamogawensis]
MYIAIAGNIGCGKTTLTQLLSDRFGWRALFESTTNNPYLEDFYEDMEKWAFHLQTYFLNHRFEQIQEATVDNPVIQDRSLYEGTYVFTENLRRSGLINQRDFENYTALSKLYENKANAPHLLIYLRADVEKLHKNIQKRGRDYEQSIPSEYLSNLNELYEEWIGNYDKGGLLVVDVNDVDFVNNPHDFERIASAIESAMRIRKSPMGSMI